MLGLGAAAIADPELSIEVQGDKNIPRSISGSLRLPTSNDQGVCFYIPYNDPKYGEDRGYQRRFDRIAGQRSQSTWLGGETTITSQQTMEWISDTLVKVFPANGVIDIQFRSRVPLPPNSSAKDVFYDGFHPQIIACDIPEEEASHTTNQAYSFIISLPSDLTYMGPGETLENSVRGTIFTNSLVFALGSNLKKMRTEVAGTSVEVFYRSESVLDLVPTLQLALENMTRIAGAFPFPKLTVIESSELQRHALSGIIAINAPRQEAFKTLFGSLLNWQHWMTVRLTSQQWFGAKVKVATLRDRWLTEGISEFLTSEILLQDPALANLFTPGESGKYFISFDFLQVIEATAATLRRSGPFTVLTDNFGNTEEAFSDQHPLQFIRNTFALRQASSQIGKLVAYRFLRQVVSNFSSKSITPKEFLSAMDIKPSPFSPALRDTFYNAIMRWWSTSDWPDFELDEFSSRKVSENPEKWETLIVVEQNGNLDYAPIVELYESSVTSTKARARPVDDGWALNFVTNAQPIKVVVDPDHESYDYNRFNNSSEASPVVFFPGNANTLRDDAYTLLWLPYAYKRPGEDFALAVQGAMFRYIQSGLFVTGAVMPESKKSEFSIRHRYDVLKWAIHGDIQMVQDFEGERITEITGVRSPLLPFGPTISLNLKLRQRQAVGLPDTVHPTTVANIGIKPGGALPWCSYKLGAQYETAPKDWHKTFHYERNWAYASGNCSAFRLNLSVRVFGGRLSTFTESPELAKFRPVDLKESKIRLNRPGLLKATEISSVTSDLTFPFVIPLPDNSLVLSRRMKGRVFYDVGRQTKPLRTEYRAAGAGFFIPFGGDVSGAGSLSLTKLTLLGIFYTSAEGEVSRKPGFVFDLSGEL